MCWPRGGQTALSRKYCETVTDNGILCYDRINGGGAVVQLDGRGLPRFKTGIGLSADWASLTAIGSHVFFYDGNHTGAIVAINPSGSTTQTDTETNLSTWTNIVATDNYLVFYNSSTGVLASAVVSNIEQLQDTSTSSGIINASLFANIGDDLMLYDPGTGNYNIFQILYNGGLTDALTLGASGVIAKGFTQVARLGRSILFYNSDSGKTLIGTIDQSSLELAQWKQTQATKLLKGWSNIVTAGQFLVFYNEGSGALSVGYISTAGKWVQTDFEASAIGIGYPSVAASAR